MGTVILFSIPLGQYTMQVLSYLGRIVLVIWLSKVLTQIITWVHEDSLALIYPPSVNI